MGFLSKILSVFRGGTPTSKKPQKPVSKKVENGKRTARPERNKSMTRATAQGQGGSISRNHGAQQGSRSRTAKPRGQKAEGVARTVHAQGAQQHKGARGEFHRTHTPRVDRGQNDQNLRPKRSTGFRPGGALSAEQIAQNAAAHAAWDLASYTVEAVEGKRRFLDLDLPSEVLHAIADLGFQYCTPIQAQSLEYSLKGQNVAGRAQTGTGKTAAFLIAILTRYLRTPEKRNLKPGTPRALVLAPTRELVIQICKDAEALGKYCGGVRSLAVYGGMDYDRQRDELADEPVDLLVATPGRLLDFVRNRIVDLRQIDTLVIDEADRMLDMGFIPDVRAIVNHLPDRDNRCTMLYSATLNETVMRLASMWMREPVRVEIESDSLATATVTQLVYIARAEEKFKLLYNYLAKNKEKRSIIFCNRKSTTERVCENLRRYGIPCEMLSGDVNQVKRLKILDHFRAGDLRTVVATDVAGRGIHVDDISFVFNFDFPNEPDDYVHRIGRTGRAGRTGTAISFADENESFIIPDIEKYINESLKCIMPEEWMLADLPQKSARKPQPVATEAVKVEEAKAEVSVEAAATAETPVVVSPETTEPSVVAVDATAVTVPEIKPVKEAKVSTIDPPVVAEKKPEVVATPVSVKVAPKSVTAPKIQKGGVRPTREPKFRPRTQRAKVAETNHQPPRSEKPVAKQFLRTQADGPQDGSESHHAAAIVNRPIYAPGKHGPVSDEWSPGAK